MKMLFILLIFTILINGYKGCNAGANGCLICSASNCVACITPGNIYK